MVASNALLEVHMKTSPIVTTSRENKKPKELLDPKDDEDISMVDLATDSHEENIEKWRENIGSESKDKVKKLNSWEKSNDTEVQVVKNEENVEPDQSEDKIEIITEQKEEISKDEEIDQENEAVTNKPQEEALDTEQETIKIKLYKCKSCQNTFNTRDKIGKHNGAVHGERYCCRFCNESFPTSNDLQYHIFESHSPTFTKCPQCDDKFEKSDDIQDHMKDKHNKQEIFEDIHHKEHIVICGECGSSFMSGVDYDYHLAKCDFEMTTDEEQYTCSVCVQKFPLLTDVWLHIAREHDKRYVNQDKLIVNLLAEQNLELKEELATFRADM